MLVLVPEVWGLGDLGNVISVARGCKFNRLI